MYTANCKLGEQNRIVKDIFLLKGRRGEVLRRDEVSLGRSDASSPKPVPQISHNDGSAPKLLSRYMTPLYYHGISTLTSPGEPEHVSQPSGRWCFYPRYRMREWGEFTCCRIWVVDPEMTCTGPRVQRMHVRLELRLEDI